MRVLADISAFTPAEIGTIADADTNLTAEITIEAERIGVLGTNGCPEDTTMRRRPLRRLTELDATKEIDLCRLRLLITEADVTDEIYSYFRLRRKTFGSSEIAAGIDSEKIFASGAALPKFMRAKYR